MNARQVEGYPIEFGDLGYWKDTEGFRVSGLP